tara:strand:+ start:2644 stop:3090 length:447 start_codon:yes stop_codon:yes gene_type:complete
MSIERTPYTPTAAEWTDTLDLLCAHCEHAWGCDVLEGMIEMKEGKAWPAGGWVTDPGAGITCLSYQPQQRARLSRQRLRQAMRDAVPMCDGCAAQKGSEASVSLHTQQDFAAAVKNRSVFACHDGDNHGKPCGGWCQAVRRQMKGARS